MKILFVCKYNRFRSKIAEAYFKKINKNPKIKTISAGVIKGKPTPLSTVKTAKKLGIIVPRKTNFLDENILESKKLKYIVIVANDVPRQIFKRFNKKIILWKIRDTSVSDQKKVEKIIKEIMKKVNNLNKSLEK